MRLPDRLARFRHEAKVLASLNHPNTVTIHSAEKIDGIPFMAMELVRGESLRHHLPEEGLAIPELLDLAIPVADALAAAHDGETTRRDLKPERELSRPGGGVDRFEFRISDLVLAAQSDAYRLLLLASQLNSNRPGNRNQKAEDGKNAAVRFLIPGCVLDATSQTAAELNQRMKNPRPVLGSGR